jgi:DNA-binding GntR family transcriptional regulator
MQVVHVDLNMIRDAFQFRLFLEREAVAVFTESASVAVLARLHAEHESIVAECERAQRKGGVGEDLISRAQQIDWDLHATIVDSLDNAIVTNAYRVNSIKIRLIRQEQTRLYDALVIPTMREHLTVIDAIASRKPARAVVALGAHITSARNRAMGLR